MGDAWYRILYLVLLSKCQKWYRLGIPNSLLVAAMISVKPLQTWGWGESQAPARSKIKRFLMLNLRK